MRRILNAANPITPKSSTPLVNNKPDVDENAIAGHAAQAVEPQVLAQAEATAKQLMKISMVFML